MKVLTTGLCRHRNIADPGEKCSHDHLICLFLQLVELATVTSGSSIYSFFCNVRFCPFSRPVQLSIVILCTRES